jgi:hypothetical protein
MWIITKYEEEDLFDVLTDEDGNTIKFQNQVEAWRYLELLCHDFNISSKDFVESESIEICRVH